MAIFVSSSAPSPVPSITDYAGLQSAIIGWSHRSGDTDFKNSIPDFITLTEATMQLTFKLLEFEEYLSIPVTNGLGYVPADYSGARSALWDGTTKYPLQYITPELYDARQNISSDVPGFFTMSGSALRVSPSATGSLVLTYFGKFIPLSDTNTSNSILLNTPACYLYGALHHAYNWLQDDEQMKKYGVLFNAAMDDVIGQDNARKFAGNLQVRAR
jgi:hypothetical protein